MALFQLSSPRLLEDLVKKYEMWLALPLSSFEESHPFLKNGVIISTCISQDVINLLPEAM